MRLGPFSAHYDEEFCEKNNFSQKLFPQAAPS